MLLFYNYNKYLLIINSIFIKISFKGIKTRNTFRENKYLEK
ncbi:replication protein [Clostridium botulinum]|nr:replication protein [Clostridium botulinum]NFD80197.1 replication protein [Clostridium botulinum]NFD91154.1 replication protein [Clostridium botulinum]NFE20212.1 replication protein [Clostridium botulinum]NFF48710.1 replication protein [Clostridium botulinum]